MSLVSAELEKVEIQAKEVEIDGYTLESHENGSSSTSKRNTQPLSSNTFQGNHHRPTSTPTNSPAQINTDNGSSSRFAAQISTSSKTKKGSSPLTSPGIEEDTQVNVVRRLGKAAVPTAYDTDLRRISSLMQKDQPDTDGMNSNTHSAISTSSTTPFYISPLHPPSTHPTFSGLNPHSDFAEWMTEGEGGGQKVRIEWFVESNKDDERGGWRKVGSRVMNLRDCREVVGNIVSETRVS